MQSNLERWRLQLFCLLALAAANCQSAEPMPTVAVTTPGGGLPKACQKADEMWRERILPSRYGQLPPLTAPGVFDLFKLLNSHYAIKALTTEGDELETGRRKLIHAFGAEARFRLVISSPPAGGLTGIFASGAECVIGRFSLAAKPSAERSTPALALKFFIDGDRPSLNLHLMHAVDGQPGHNFFDRDFSNFLPPASGLATRLLAASFERTAGQFGARDPNPGHLTLEHLAGVRPDGTNVALPIAPDQLLFRPTAQARALMQAADAATDFRSALAGLAVGQPVYEVYSLAAGDLPETARLLGRLILTAPVVASRYGDEQLQFRHNMATR